MADWTTSGLRRAVMAILIVALTLTGFGRAVATSLDPAGASAAIPGVQVPICHAGGGGVPSDPERPTRHDCCDACALLAPAVLPAAPALDGPAPMARLAAPAAAAAWVSVLARPRSPRQSRGPPAA